MREAKHRPNRRPELRPIRKIPDLRIIQIRRIKRLPHILSRQLRKSARLQIQPLQQLIHPRHIPLPNLAKQPIRKRAPAMRRRHRGQRLDLQIPRLQMADQVSRVQPTHAVRDDIDRLAPRFRSDVLQQRHRALLDGPRGGHARGDHLDVVGGQGFFDPAPVLHAGQESAGQAELVEAQEAVREHDRVARGLVCGAEGGEVVFDETVEVVGAGVGGLALGLGVWVRAGGREP